MLRTQQVEPVSAPAIPPATILVVEDDAAYRYAAGAVLRNAGFAVLEAADYRGATQLLRAATRSTCC